jgi:hypothetical protein
VTYWSTIVATLSKDHFTLHDYVTKQDLSADAIELITLGAVRRYGREG